jgi:NAD(P) transhydrogenase
VSTVVERETEVVRAQLTRNGIAIYQGDALFLDPHTVEVQDNGEKTWLKADKILVACGTRPAHSPEIPFDNRRIVDTDHLSGLDGLPKEVIVVGAGVVGLEYTSFMAALGAEVTLIDQRATALEFVDRQIVEALSYHLRQFGVKFRLAEKVTRVEIDPVRERVVVELESGKKMQGDALIYAVGCQANGDLLNLEAAGLQADTRGRLKVNEFFQTDVKLLGVHVWGQRATEIIHIGQAVLFYGGSAEYFRDAIFNYPTLAEAYKVAALSGLNKL